MDQAAKLAQLADSYLDHIRIAIEADDRGAPFRDFIDNWAAFASATDHHRTGSNRVIWFNNPNAITKRAMLLSLPFVSTGASAILSYAAEQRDEYRMRRKADDKEIRLIVDHAVPLASMIEWLFEPGADLSRNAIRQHLKRWYHLGVLTSSEDATLNRLGLRSKMPDDWDGKDLTARYHQAAIKRAT
jgi:hypothetical protein